MLQETLGEDPRKTILREAMKFKLRVSSGTRTPAQNKAAGGADNSYHLYGSALDLAGSPENMRSFADHMKVNYGQELAELIHGSGDHKDHVHVAWGKQAESKTSGLLKSFLGGEKKQEATAEASSDTLRMLRGFTKAQQATQPPAPAPESPTAATPAPQEAITYTDSGMPITPHVEPTRPVIPWQNVTVTGLDPKNVTEAQMKQRILETLGFKPEEAAKVPYQLYIPFEDAKKQIKNGEIVAQIPQNEYDDLMEKLAGFEAMRLDPAKLDSLQITGTQFHDPFGGKVIGTDKGFIAEDPQQFLAGPVTRPGTFDDGVAAVARLADVGTRPFQYLSTLAAGLQRGLGSDISRLFGGAGGDYTLRSVLDAAAERFYTGKTRPGYEQPVEELTNLLVEKFGGDRESVWAQLLSGTLGGLTDVSNLLPVEAAAGRFSKAKPNSLEIAESLIDPDVRARGLQQYAEEQAQQVRTNREAYFGKAETNAQREAAAFEAIDQKLAKSQPLSPDEVGMIRQRQERQQVETIRAKVKEGKPLTPKELEFLERQGKPSEETAKEVPAPGPDPAGAATRQPKGQENGGSASQGQAPIKQEKGQVDEQLQRQNDQVQPEEAQPSQKAKSDAVPPSRAATGAPEPGSPTETPAKADTVRPLTVREEFDRARAEMDALYKRKRQGEDVDAELKAATQRTQELSKKVEETQLAEQRAKIRSINQQQSRTVTVPHDQVKVAPAQAPSLASEAANQGDFALSEPQVEPAKGDHGKLIQGLFRSPDREAGAPSFFAEKSVRKALNLGEMPDPVKDRAGYNAALKEAKDMLAEAVGVPRSSHITPEQLKQWADNNGLSAEAMNALESARRGYDDSVKVKQDLQAKAEAATPKASQPAVDLQPKTPKITGEESLSAFIHKMGGVKPYKGLNAGELRAYISSKEGGRPGLINSKGKSVSEMREAAEAAGFGPFETDNQFLDAFINDVQGRKTYSKTKDWDSVIEKELKQAQEDAITDPDYDDVDNVSRAMKEPEFRQAMQRLLSEDVTDAEIERFRQHASYVHNLPEDVIDDILQDAANERAGARGTRPNETGAPEAPAAEQGTPRRADTTPRNVTEAEYRKEILDGLNERLKTQRGSGGPDTETIKDLARLAVSHVREGKAGFAKFRAEIQRDLGAEYTKLKPQLLKAWQQAKYLAAGADDSTSTYPGNLGVRKMKGLTPELREIEARAAQALEGDLEGHITKYLERNTEGGIVTLNTDEARTLFPEYDATHETRALNAAAVHEPSGALVDIIWKRLLEQQGPKGRNDILFTAGGGGSGKTYALRTVGALAEVKKHSYVIYDKTFSALESSAQNIEDALAHGKNVFVAMVYTPEDIAARNAYKRATGETGRTVPEGVLANDHYQAPETVLELFNRYKDDERVYFGIVENNGKDDPILITVDELRQKVHNRTREGVKAKVQEAIDNEHVTRSQTQEIQDYTYRGFTGADPSREGRPHHAGDSRGITQGAPGTAGPGAGRAGTAEVTPPRTEIERRKQIIQSILDTLSMKDQLGSGGPDSARLISDLSKLASSYVREGTEGFKKFKAELQSTRAVDYEALKPHLLNAWKQAKQAAGSGQGEGRAAAPKTPNPDKLTFRQQAVELAGVPRALQSSADISAPFRQGAVFTITEPVQSFKAGKDMFKALVSNEENYKKLQIKIEADPYYQLAKKSEVDFTATAADVAPGNLAVTEESFANKLVGKLPHVKYAEQAYVTYLNSQRMSVFKKFARELENKGLTFEKNPQEFKDIAKFINYATGRGDLGKLGEKYGDLLNSVFYAPKYTASRFQVLNPVMYFKMSPGARRIAVRKMTEFAGAVGAALTVAHWMGAEVSADPDSADFLKIKLGNTRYDVLAGFQQPMRFLYRFSKGLVNNTTGAGNERGQNPDEVLTRFARSKSSPMVSFLADWWTGKDYVGNKFNMGRAALERVAPLFVKDMAYALWEEGLVGGAKTLPAGIGFGVSTYKNRDAGPFSDPVRRALKAAEYRPKEPKRQKDKLTGEYTESEQDFDKRIEETRKLVDERIQGVIESEAYKGLDPKLKKIVLADATESARREYTEALKSGDRPPAPEVGRFNGALRVEMFKTMFDVKKSDRYKKLSQKQRDYVDEEIRSLFNDQKISDPTALKVARGARESFKKSLQTSLGNIFVGAKMIETAERLRQ